MIVVDASAVIELLLQSSGGMNVAKRLFESPTPLCAPHLLDVEVVQVLRRYARSGDLTSERGTQALNDLADLPLTRYPHVGLLNRAWELRANASAYDAMYLALAEAIGAVLVTRDRRLASVPGHKVVVEVL